MNLFPTVLKLFSNCFPIVCVIGEWSIGVTLKSPMSDVGSTAKGRNSTGLQQNLFRTLTCRFVVITQKGSGATLTSRIKAVLPFGACFLQAPRRRNHGSSVTFPGKSYFTSPIFAANFLKSFTSCRSRGICQTPEQAPSERMSSLSTWCTASRGCSPFYEFRIYSFVLSQVLISCRALEFAFKFP